MNHSYLCEYPARECLGAPPCGPFLPDERDGLRVGDEVMVNDRWPAVVIGFSTLSADVAVRWTGKRPVLDDESTLCRSHVEIRHADKADPGGGVA